MTDVFDPLHVNYSSLKIAFLFLTTAHHRLKNIPHDNIWGSHSDTVLLNSLILQCVSAIFDTLQNTCLLSQRDVREREREGEREREIERKRERERGCLQWAER